MASRPPVPHPPQHIHRARGGVAAPPRPPKPARRSHPPRIPRRYTLWGRFWLGFVRRLYFGSKTLIKLALCLPILAFMVWFSYTVDRSGLFQGELAPRRIVDLMLQGYDVTNFDSMDEREVVQLYAQDVAETPEVIAVGSSRILQFNRELVGVDSFFNMGVTGADVRDNMTSYYKMITYGKAPKVLIWSVDPWVFYDSENAFDERADADLYNEFLTKVLGVPTDYEEPDPVELWKALAEPAYFQGNVDYFVKNRGQSTVTDDDGNTIEFNPVEGDPFDQSTNIKRSDGSILYNVEFRNQTQEQILAQAAAACSTFNSVHMEGFNELSQTQLDAFDAFIRYARDQGTTVILVLSPWHPYLYNYLLGETELHQGFFQVENWLRQYCADNDVPLYGSYDPACVEGIEEMDFFDGLHCKDTGIRKFFPGVPAVLEAIQTDSLPDPLAVTPRTTAPVPEGTEDGTGDAAAATAEDAA